jgi:hypothetical protein
MLYGNEIRNSLILEVGFDGVLSYGFAAGFAGLKARINLRSGNDLAVVGFKIEFESLGGGSDRKFSHIENFLSLFSGVFSFA